MAWRIEKNVVRGLIQNIVPGRVVGAIWLKGLNRPLELNLKGNAYRDVAGARLEFANPDPVEGDYAGLELFQDGVVGDMTASKKVKELLDPDWRMGEDGAPPQFVWSNCLYLEWFSEANGRVLIETTRFTWKTSLPKWSLSDHEEKAQQEANRQAMFNFMEELARAIDTEEPEPPDDGEMNEFQWEAFLQKSDARSDMLLELFEKYEGEPNCEEIIAEAMGWDVDAVEGVTEELFDDWEEDEEETDLPSDDADDAYLPSHPLIAEMLEITSRLFYEAESRGLLTREQSNPWNQLIWHAQMAVGKLIAALEEVAEGIPSEPGFVVATLKRALHLVHLTIATLEACASVEKTHRKWTAEIRRDLFAMRESVLDLMQTIRSQS